MARYQEADRAVDRTAPSQTVDPSIGRRIADLYRRRSRLFHSIFSLVLAVFLWEWIAARTSPLVLVSLSEIWDAGVDRMANGRLLTDLSATMRAFSIGLVISTVVGVVIGVLLATSRVIYDIFDPWISSLYSTPVVALAPLFIVLFGIDLTSKVAVVVLLSIFPMIMNSAAGIRNAEPALIECAYAFGARRFAQFRLVMLPAALPFMITGLRLAVGRGLVGVVVAEFFGARAGLGNMIFESSQRFDTPLIFVGVFVLAFLGTTLIKIMHWLESKAARWRVAT